MHIDEGALEYNHFHQSACKRKANLQQLDAKIKLHSTTICHMLQRLNNRHKGKKMHFKISIPLKRKLSLNNNILHQYCHIKNMHILIAIQK